MVLWDSSDGRTLKNDESEDVDEQLIVYYAQQTTLSLYLSTRPTRVEKTCHVSTKLVLESFVSNDLLCNASWKSTRIETEANTLLGLDCEVA